MLKKILLVAVLSAAIFAFAGCQTVQGVGKDITWTGDAVAGVLEER